MQPHIIITPPPPVQETQDRDDQKLPGSEMGSESGLLSDLTVKVDASLDKKLMVPSLFI